MSTCRCCKLTLLELSSKAGLSIQVQCLCAKCSSRILGQETLPPFSQQRATGQLITNIMTQVTVILGLGNDPERR